MTHAVKILWTIWFDFNHKSQEIGLVIDKMSKYTLVFDHVPHAIELNERYNV